MKTRVLYVCGSSLFRNTSANMSHNAYVQGFLENGCEVEVIMPDVSFGPVDSGFPRFAGARYRLVRSEPPWSAMAVKLKALLDGPSGEVGSSSDERSGASPPEGSRKRGAMLRSASRWLAASANAWLTRRDPHRLSRTWLRRASRFSSSRPYHLVVSNSSPASSHRLAATLISRRRVRTDRWIQLWEDPWFHDVYRRGEAPRIAREEADLLRRADEVFYVSPLTLEYQRGHFPESAHKMRLIPLPSFTPMPSAPAERRGAGPSFGYFGDYYSHTRNLVPFYEAACALDVETEICGDSDLELTPTGRVRVRGRVPLGVLSGLQASTDVLVAVCNLRGGQLPGKLYHDAATSKPVLLILDGTAREQEVIRDYFAGLGRFHFCRNQKDDIAAFAREVLDGRIPRRVAPERSFAPEAVARRLLGSNE